MPNLDTEIQESVRIRFSYRLGGSFESVIKERKRKCLQPFADGFFTVTTEAKEKKRITLNHSDLIE